MVAWARSSLRLIYVRSSQAQKVVEPKVARSVAYHATRVTAEPSLTSRKPQTPHAAHACSLAPPPVPGERASPGERADGERGGDACMSCGLPQLALAAATRVACRRGLDVERGLAGLPPVPVPVPPPPPPP